MNKKTVALKEEFPRVVTWHFNAKNTSMRKHVNENSTPCEKHVNENSTPCEKHVNPSLLTFQLCQTCPSDPLTKGRSFLELAKN